MYRYDPSTEKPPHWCVSPPASKATPGDLWRCNCGRLWQVERYRLAGVSPSAPFQHRWVRAPLLVRIVFHPLVPHTEWQWALAGVGMVAATAAAGKAGQWLGWW